MTQAMKILVCGVVAACALNGAASAATLSCPDPLGSWNRQMTMTNVDGCQFAGPVTGTPKAADIAFYFGDTWTTEGELSGGTSNGYLSIGFSTGTWDEANASGTYAINDAFWDEWGKAVISIHVGNGNGDPDWFMFLITPQTTSGEWSLARVTQKGGGLSNFFLWGAGEPSPRCVENCAPDQQESIPEPTTLALLGVAFLGAGVARQRARR